MHSHVASLQVSVARGMGPTTLNPCRHCADRHSAHLAPLPVGSSGRGVYHHDAVPPHIKNFSTRCLGTGDGSETHKNPIGGF